MPSDNKRIALNSLYLYLRMILTMFISFYTSRKILEVLGVEDFGINNIVSGVVMMLEFMHGSLASASQRFITFEFGIGNIDRLKRLFSNCIAVHLLLCVVVFFLFESIGLYVLNNYLVIPKERIFAANIVYQCSIVVFFLKIYSVPYDALIIAHEKMKAFAYISLLESVLKLLIVLLLFYVSYDKLIVYSICWLLIGVIIRNTYVTYCRKNFEESNVRPSIDKSIFYELLSFSGLNLIEIFANILSDQGINILLNIFFGPLVNAARAVSLQANNALSSITQNFTVAINPQITKSCATKDYDRMKQLMFNGNKYAFFLFLIIAAPAFYCVDDILSIWLVEVPDFSNIFFRLLLILNLCRMLTNTFYIGINATGNIKRYQIGLGIYKLLILPFALIVIILYKEAHLVFYVLISFEIISIFIKLYFLKEHIPISILGYSKTIVLRCFYVFTIVFLLNYFIKRYFLDSLLLLIVYCLLSIMLSLIVIYALGINQSEKLYIRNLFVTYINKVKK